MRSFKGSIELDGEYIIIDGVEYTSMDLTLDGERCGLVWLFTSAPSMPNTYAYRDGDKYVKLNITHNTNIAVIEDQMIRLYEEIGDWKTVFECVEV